MDKDTTKTTFYQAASDFKKMLINFTLTIKLKIVKM